MGTYRAVKVVYRMTFEHDRPYEREFGGMQKFEPVSRTHAGLVNVLQIGRNDQAGYFYYIMELADTIEDAGEKVVSGKVRKNPRAARFRPIRRASRRQSTRKLTPPRRSTAFSAHLPTFSPAHLLSGFPSPSACASASR